MRTKRRWAVVAVAAVAVAALALPASADGRVFVDSDDSVDCGGGLVLDVHVEGWFQLNTAGEESGVRVSTIHQTITYTNPDTGESLSLQNTGVAQISDEILVAGSTEDDLAVVIRGLRNLTEDTWNGNLVSICEVLS